MELESELRALAAEIEWPQTPALRPELAPRRRLMRRDRALVLAVAFVAAVLAAAFAVPQSRGAILRFLGLGAVHVEFVERLPAAQERPLTEGLGPTISKAVARDLLGRPPLLPPLAPAPALHAQDGVVSLLFLHEADPVLLSEIDQLQRSIEERVVLTIARRQPMAVDLREIVGELRVATDLERIGDLAKNNAKRVTALGGDFNPLKLIRGLEHMARLVLTQIKAVLDAYAAHDVQAAMQVWKGDEEVDALCTSLFRELLTYMMEDPRNISFCIHLMFCAKNIERIGDHATNIAETVFYMIEGQQIPDKRPKGDMTTFASATPGT